MSALLKCEICEKGHLNQRDGRLLWCDTCHSARLAGLPTEEETRQLYQASYRPRPSGERFPRWIEALLRSSDRSIAWRLRKQIPTHLVKPRLLEVGCGRGTLLDAAVAVGFEVRGTELSQECIAACKKRGLCVDAASLEQLIAEGCKFDSIVALHVLEHLPSVRAFREQAARLLAPGGLLLIEIPNARSPFARDACWFGRDLPNHLFQIDAKAFGETFEQHGWELCSAEQWSWKFGPFSIAQSFANKLGIGRHNLGYHFLQKPTLKNALPACFQLAWNGPSLLFYPLWHLATAPDLRGEIVRFWFTKQ